MIELIQHRWSGFPGAWCLDCGAECQMEAAICCKDCFVVCCPEDEGLPEKICDNHKQAPCTAPGQRLADPYSGWGIE